MTPSEAQPFARPGRGDGRLVAGVCAGLAARWDLPPLALRAAFLVAAAAFGAGALIYLALALAMPARTASSDRVARSAEVGRTLLFAARAVGAALALAVVGAAAVVLALFGLASVALVLASACLLVVILNPALRPAPLGAVAIALALPAAAVALGDTQIARQLGTERIELRTPADVDPRGYRAGTGELLVDLRRFSAAPGTTTTIRARADLRALVVALPRTRCFSLVVDQTLDRAWPAQVLDHRRPDPLRLGAPSREPTARERRLAEAGQPASLVAFGRPVLGTAVRYRRAAPTADAPILHLVLTTGRAQAIVRDYPQTARPLEDPWWPRPQVGAADRFGIPRGQLAARTVPDDPLVPSLLRRLEEQEPFVVANRIAPTNAVDGVIGGRRPARVDEQRYERLRRFLRQEVLLRAAARAADADSVRFAGPCAPRREVAQALTNVTLPGSRHATSRLLARWRVIAQRWPQLRRHLRLYHGSIEPRSMLPSERGDATPERP